MDNDSSSKFISSLTKFLQSLCNGYVEFENGVEVIGHIYLSVDTGEKINYILNEKLCKTEENCVQFISNSFSAQPAEKPKPKNKHANDRKKDECTDVVLIKDNITSQTHNSDLIAEAKSQQLCNTLKRPHTTSSYNDESPRKTKHSRKNRNPASKYFDNSTFSQNDTPSHFPDGQESEHYDYTFPPQNSEESSYSGTYNYTDVKPTVDEDVKVITVKEECESNLEQSDNFLEMKDPECIADNQVTTEYDLYQADAISYGNNSDFDVNVNKAVFQDTTSVCPVEGCDTVCGFYTYRRHWQNSHVLFTPHFPCPLCSFQSKRRHDVVRHSRYKHCSEVGAIEKTSYRRNKQYKDPKKMTFEEAKQIHMNNCKMSALLNQ